MSTVHWQQTTHFSLAWLTHAWEQWFERKVRFLLNWQSFYFCQEVSFHLVDTFVCRFNVLNYLSARLQVLLCSIFVLRWHKLSFGLHNGLEFVCFTGQLAVNLSEHCKWLVSLLKQAIMFGLNLCAILCTASIDLHHNEKVLHLLHARQFVYVYQISQWKDACLDWVELRANFGEHNLQVNQITRERLTLNQSLRNTK
jgi:hypothetical protein